jgi:hypothetical protein
LYRTYGGQEFFSFVCHFSPAGAKNDIQQEESTMLPQANSTVAKGLLEHIGRSAGRKMILNKVV